MQLTGIDRLFWVLSFLGNCGLLAVLLGRRKLTVLPIFTLLIATNIARTIILFFTLRFGSADQYFYTYWTLAFLDTLLQLTLAYELATHVFQPLGAWAPDVRKSLLTLIGLSLLVAGGLTWLAVPPTETLRLAVVIRGDFFSSALMTELFVVMIALSVTLGLPWRSHVSRIAQGYGVFCLVGIITDAAHSYLGSIKGIDGYKLISHIQIGLYLFCLLYWIITLSMKEPEARKLPPQLHMELRALQEKASLILSNLRTMGSAQ